MLVFKIDLVFVLALPRSSCHLFLRVESFLGPEPLFVCWVIFLPSLHGYSSITVVDVKRSTVVLNSSFVIFIWVGFFVLVFAVDSLALPHFGLYVFLALAIMLRIVFRPIILSMHYIVFVMLITPKVNRLTWFARVVSWRVEAMVLHWFDRQTVHIDCTSRGYSSHLLSEVDRGLDFKLLSHICLLPSLLLLPFLFFLILFVACWDAVDGTYKSNNTKDSRYCDDLCVFAVITRAGPAVLASVWS